MITQMMKYAGIGLSIMKVDAVLIFERTIVKFVSGIIMKMTMSMTCTDNI